MSKSVLVRHETRYDSNGNAIGVAFRKVGHVVQRVIAEYMHKDTHGNHVVKTSSGDIWAVKPVSHDDYQYTTVTI